MSRAIDLTGQNFGRLTVVKRSPHRSHGGLTWECRCTCGNTTTARSGDLRSGQTKSCGCLRGEQERQPNPVLHFDDKSTVIGLRRKNGDVLPCYIDTEDFPRISPCTWNVARRKKQFYVMATKNGPCKGALMHRFLLGLKRPDQQADHIDHNGLNNQRANLRRATNQQNNWNVRPNSNNIAQFKGVSWDKRYQNWRARITMNGEQIWLGAFPTPEAAALAYNTAAKKHFGEFAYLNPVQEAQAA